MSELVCGDTREVLAGMDEQSVHCVITSPPYWGLRDYGCPEVVFGGDAQCQHEWGERFDKRPSAGGEREYGSYDGGTGRGPGPMLPGSAFCQLCGAWRGQFGLEPTPEMYVEHTLEFLRAIWRVLRDDGTVWWVIGDSYARNPSRGIKFEAGTTTYLENRQATEGNRGPAVPEGLKEKDLVMIPFRVALAAQTDGWWVRSVVIWSKPNPMPESVRDRPTTAHEYVLLLTKSARYFYDADAIREPLAEGSLERYAYSFGGSKNEHLKATDKPTAVVGNREPTSGRNKRTVWEVATAPFSGAKLLADYVGLDGKPYIASPDCPIHGHLADAEKWHTLECDEQRDQWLRDNPDMRNRPVLGPLFDGQASLQDSSLDDHPSTTDCPNPDSVRGRNLESTVENRRSASPDEPNGASEMIYRTSHTQELLGRQDCSSGSPGRDSSLIATQHSTASHKTDRVSETNPSDTLFAEMSGRTADKPTLPERSGHDDHALDSNTGADAASDETEPCPSAQTACRTTYTHTSGPPDSNYTCSCTISQTDHYATFPPKLVEPMILAGCPAGGIVLDPFCGTGTVCWQANGLGRDWIGIDIDPRSIEMAKERLRMGPVEYEAQDETWIQPRLR